MRSFANAALVALALAMAAAAPAQAATSAKRLYDEALAKETVLRRDMDKRPATPLLRRVRTLVGAYETVVRRYPRSGYSDNALWQAAMLSADAYWQFGEAEDKRAALRLFTALTSRYPSSSLVKQASAQARRLSAPAAPARAAAPPAARPAARTATPAPAPRETARLTAIRRETLPDALRITLELEREAAFDDERLDGPPRVFVDLDNTTAAADLKDATLAFEDDVVRQVRVGASRGAKTRVVLDLEGAARHSVYALYDPYRVVIDIERTAAAAVVAKDSHAELPQQTAPDGKKRDVPGASWAADPTPPRTTAPDPAPGPRSASAAPPVTAGRNGPSTPPPVEEPRDEAAPAAAPAVVPPATNRGGGYSLSRQLGLGIHRIVIDPGHGGHDPGAQVRGLNEADVALDVALRLEKLLLQQPGVEVILTRRTNVFIPLEERTAIANRAQADLFLSVHVNAARNPKARGIETYFLNFAPDPEAEAIAARENAGSSKTMSHLPDIVRAIALNNKIDESKDFASLIQTSMTERLRRVNRDTRNLGVKQAPFMVLIGATMPSVLAEISFLTNRQEGALLKTTSYRQQIAEALLSGIMKYQKSLKATAAVAAQER